MAVVVSLFSTASFASIAVGDQYLWICQGPNPQAPNGYEVDYEKATVASIDQAHQTFMIQNNWYGPNDFTLLESSSVNGPNDIDGGNAYYATKKSAKEIVDHCVASGGIETKVFITGKNINACKVANTQGGYVWLTRYNFGGFGDIQSVKFTTSNPSVICHLLNIVPANSAQFDPQIKKDGIPNHD